MKKPYTSLYVHVPFCAGKCAYCAFYSMARFSVSAVRAYLDRVFAEFARWNEACAPLETVYIGGGTPTALSASGLAELLAGVRRSFRFRPGGEFTVECNPETLSDDKVAVLAEYGVNRVSLGVQSFFPALRRVLGRRGTPVDVVQAVERLRAARIDNLGGDLIYGIPGQSLDMWRTDLRRACELGVSHLSTYELTIEEGSRLARTGASPPPADAAVAFWETAAAVAADFGLVRYEVSNLARPGAECRHNMDVWCGGTLLGCGPAACSFDGETRYANPPNLHRWLRSSHREADVLALEGRAREILAFGLRTVGGWSLSRFRARTGFDPMALCADEIRGLAEDGLLIIEPDCLRPTDRGLLFADTVAERIIE